MNRVIAIGASLGGVSALRKLAAGLPADLPAAVLVVLHVGNHRSILPALLAADSALPAAHAVDGEALAAGRLYVAPPDHHMLVLDDRVVLTRGPKEHHTRPAIDPLFRSVALAWGPAAIGVVLTGSLDDGTAGLQDIKRSGGIAVVQDPNEAHSRDMPDSALRHVEVDHCVALPAMPKLLASLAATPAPRRADAPNPRSRHEHALATKEGDAMQHLEAIGRPSPYVCPECHGGLWELIDSHPPRFRCHTGHAFTARTLQDTLATAADEAIWSGLRALQERRFLLEQMARRLHESGEQARAAPLEEAARRLHRQADALRELFEDSPEPID